MGRKIILPVMLGIAILFLIPIALSGNDQAFAQVFDKYPAQFCDSVGNVSYFGIEYNKCTFSSSRTITSGDTWVLEGNPAFENLKPWVLVLEPGQDLTINEGGTLIINEIAFVDLRAVGDDSATLTINGKLINKGTIKNPVFTFEKDEASFEDVFDHIAGIVFPFGSAFLGGAFDNSNLSTQGGRAQIVNNNEIENFGNIHNVGIFTNNGIIENKGFINNGIPVRSCATDVSATLSNFGTIENFGVIQNSDVIINENENDNPGIINNNNGIITNLDDRTDGGSSDCSAIEDNWKQESKNGLNYNADNDGIKNYGLINNNNGGIILNDIPDNTYSKELAKNIALTIFDIVDPGTGSDVLDTLISIVQATITAVNDGEELPVVQMLKSDIRSKTNPSSPPPTICNDGNSHILINGFSTISNLEGAKITNSEDSKIINMCRALIHNSGEIQNDGKIINKAGEIIHYKHHNFNPPGWMINQPPSFINSASGEIINKHLRINNPCIGGDPDEDCKFSPRFSAGVIRILGDFENNNKIINDNVISISGIGLIENKENSSFTNEFNGILTINKQYAIAGGIEPDCVEQTDKNELFWPQGTRKCGVYFDNGSTLTNNGGITITNTDITTTDPRDNFPGLLIVDGIFNNYRYIHNGGVLQILQNGHLTYHESCHDFVKDRERIDDNECTNRNGSIYEKFDRYIVNERNFYNFGTITITSDTIYETKHEDQRSTIINNGKMFLLGNSNTDLKDYWSYLKNNEKIFLGCNASMDYFGAIRNNDRFYEWGDLRVKTVGDELAGRFYDDDGEQKINTIIRNYECVGPAIDLTTTVPVDVDEGERFTVSATLVNPDGNTFETEIDFGDDTTKSSSTSSTSFSADHTFGYSDNGFFDVTITATGGSGSVPIYRPDDTNKILEYVILPSSGTDTKHITSHNVQPALSITLPPEITEGIEFTLTAKSTDAGYGDSFKDENIVWGDDTDDSIPSKSNYESDAPLASEKLSSMHTYSDDGQYTITMFVTDDDDSIFGIERNVLVVNAPPEVTITSVSEKDEGEEFTLNGFTTDSGINDQLTAEICWDWDGTTCSEDESDLILTDVDVDAGQKKSFAPMHKYGDDKTYTVQVCVSDEEDTTCETTTIKVNNVNPTTTLDAISENDEGVQITLNGDVSDPGWLDTFEKITIDWDYNDVYPAGQNPIQTFTGDDLGLTIENTSIDATMDFEFDYTYGDDSLNGQYTVQVCVEDDDGGEGCNTVDVEINNVNPIVTPDAIDPVDENTEITITGIVTDQGWLDTFKDGTVDWGDDTGIANVALTNYQNEELGLASMDYEVSHTYGDNGVYTATVCIKDDNDGQGCEDVELTINNVKPSIGQITAIPNPQDENIPLDFTGQITDPGSDDLFVSWDWDDTFSDSESYYLVDSDNPDGLPTPSIDPRDEIDTQTHTWGDNGEYTVEFCVWDDDMKRDIAFSDDDKVCKSITVTINNVNPTAEIDETDTLLVQGTPTFMGQVNIPMDFTGYSEDPGSEDITFTWDWDNLANSVETHYLVDSSNPDLLPTPSIDPRDLTDDKTKTWTDACLYDVTLTSDDDDAGTAQDSTSVIIVGDADQIRSAGYWQTSAGKLLTGKGNAFFTNSEYQCLLDISSHMSAVYSEDVSAATIDDGFEALRMGQETIMEQLNRQILAAWLNFANGSIAMDDLVDTDGDGTPDTVFSEVMDNAEIASATNTDVEEHKDILDALNNSR